MKTKPGHPGTRLLPAPIERNRELAEDITLFAVSLGKARVELWHGLAQAREGEAHRWAEQWSRVSPEERHRALDRRFSPGEAAANALRELGRECGEGVLEAVVDATPSFLRFVFEERPRARKGGEPGAFADHLARRLVRECLGPQPSYSPVGTS